MLKRCIALYIFAVLVMSSCGEEPVTTEPNPNQPSTTPVATTVTVNPASVTLDAFGATQQLTATVQDQNGNTMSSVAVTWSSATTGVATISTSGLVTAVTNAEMALESVVAVRDRVVQAYQDILRMPI